MPCNTFNHGFCFGASLGIVLVGPAMAMLLLQMDADSTRWSGGGVSRESRRRLAQSDMAPSPTFEGLPAATRKGDFYQLSLNAWGGEWRKSDKAGKGTIYYRYYPYFCEQLRRLSNLQMLEIGLDVGGSLRLWRSYFPNARIVGTDVKDKSRFAKDGTRIFQAEQTDTAALQRMLDALPRPEPQHAQPFHLIIDDASHYPPDTIASFEYLFVGGLLPGGIYVLEDLSTSYDQIWASKWGLYGHGRAEWEEVGRTRKLSVINYFKAMGDLVNRRFEMPPRGSSTWSHQYANADGMREPSTAVAEWVSMVTIAQGIVVVVKKTLDEYELWPNACMPNENKRPWHKPVCKGSQCHGVCVD